MTKASHFIIALWLLSCAQAAWAERVPQPHPHNLEIARSALEGRDGYTAWSLRDRHVELRTQCHVSIKKGVCTVHTPERFVIVIPAELATQPIQDWMGSNGVNVLDVLPPSQSLHILVYHPTTGDILNTETLVVPKQPLKANWVSAKAHLSMLLFPTTPREKALATILESITPPFPEFVNPHNGRHLLQRLSQALASRELATPQTSVLLIGDWSDLSWVSRQEFSALPPGAQYTLITPMKACPTQNTHSVPGLQPLQYQQNLAFLACGVSTPQAAQQLLLERLYTKFERQNSSDSHRGEPCSLAPPEDTTLSDAEQKAFYVWFFGGLVVILKCFFLFRRRRNEP